MLCCENNTHYGWRMLKFAHTNVQEYVTVYVFLSCLVAQKNHHIAVMVEYNRERNKLQQDYSATTSNSISAVLLALKLMVAL